MANQQTVTFNINVPYKDQSDVEQVRTCVLTLTLLVDDPASELEASEGPGEITINGGVMPVGSTDPGLNAVGSGVTPDSGVMPVGSTDPGLKATGTGATTQVATIPVATTDPEAGASIDEAIAA
jgi:hypothetical protein